MPTVIDSLVVTLGLDASEYKKAANQVSGEQEKIGKQSKREHKERQREERKAADLEKKRAKEREHQRKAAVEGYHQIRRSLLELGAVLTVGMGIKSFVQYAIGGMATLGRMQSVTKLGANELAAYGLAAENAGGSQQEMTAEIMKSTQELARFKLGLGSSQVETFLGFGGKKSALKDTRSYLLGVSDLLHRINQVDPARANMVASALGFGFAGYNVLKQGPQSLQKHIAAYEKITGVTRNQTIQAQKTLEIWNALKTKLLSVGRQLFTAAQPAIREILKQLNKLAVYMGSHGKEVAQWGKDAASAVKELAQGLGEVITFLKQMQPYIDKLKPLTDALNPITSTYHDMKRGYSWAKDVGGWIDHLFGLKTGAAASAVSTSNIASSITHSDTRIQEINIHTQATDAAGIGRDIGSAITGSDIAIMANYGLK